MEKCSFCKRRLGLLSTEVRSLHPLDEEAACDHCLTTLATIALRKLPRAKAVAASVSLAIAKTEGRTIGEAEEVRARMLSAAHLPDLTKAVESVVYIVEHEAEKPSGSRDAETNAAAREALHALIHTKHVPTAKRFLDDARAGLL